MSDIIDSPLEHSETLKRLLLSICQIGYELNPNTQLIGGNLPISSLQIITFISAIEKEYSIAFDAEDMDVMNFQTISAISKMISDKS